MPCHRRYMQMKSMLVFLAALSKPLHRVILTSCQIQPCCSSSLFHHCGAWKSAGGTVTSSYCSTFRRSMSQLLKTARSRRYNTSVSVTSFRSLLFGRAFSVDMQMLTPCISFGGSQKCFAGVSPNHSKITLLLTRMYF